MKKFLNLLLVVCALTAVSCGSNKGSKSAEAEVVAEVEIPNVEVATVAARDVVQQVVFTGSVEAEVVNNIAPQAPRRIKEILFDVGDHVKEGDLLVSLENSALVQSKAQMENAKLEYERTEELYKIGGASKSEWDARRLQYEVAKLSYENLLEHI